MVEQPPRRAALVTGGSRGIGAAIVTNLALAGVSVTFTFTSSARQAFELRDHLASRGARAHAVQADNADANALRRAVSEAAAFGQGKIDLLVNNAGLSIYKRLEEFSEEEIDRILAVNVRGMVTATRAALQLMPDGGRIANIGSVNAIRMPWTGGSVYSMSKTAMSGFARGLARELGPRAITVNTVQPSPIDTDGNPADGDAAQMELSFLALPRFGAASEVAALVKFLTSDEGGYITGAELTIDGGLAA